MNESKRMVINEYEMIRRQTDWSLRKNQKKVGKGEGNEMKMGSV